MKINTKKRLSLPIITLFLLQCVFARGDSDFKKSIKEQSPKKDAKGGLSCEMHIVFARDYAEKEEPRNPIEASIDIKGLLMTDDWRVQLDELEKQLPDWRMQYLVIDRTKLIKGDGTDELTWFCEVKTDCIRKRKVEEGIISEIATSFHSLDAHSDLGSAVLNAIDRIDYSVRKTRPTPTSKGPFVFRVEIAISQEQGRKK